MKLSIKTFAILFAAAAIYSCNNSADTSATTPGTGDSVSKDNTKMSADTSHATTPATTAATSPEQDFINFAVPANTKEIAWLNAGIGRGAKDIKEHSAMMLKDHKKLGATVTDWLSKHSSITAPAVDTTNEVNINDKKGNDWDKAWSDKMMADHNNLLDHLKQAQTTVKDSALIKIITSTIPVVQSHVSMVKMVQDKHAK